MIEPSKVAPLARERYGLQCTIGQETHDKLRYAQELLSCSGGDLPRVIDRALDALIERLEKNRFAATRRPRRPGTSTNPRHIPAHVKRAVWKRDQGRCTFVSESGERCPATSNLELDHVDPVARGGTASVSGIRLRCRAHNQYEAERVFGAGFMEDKRKAARERRGARQQEARRKQEAMRAAAEREAAERARAAAQRQAEEAKRRAAAKESAEEVIPYLRALGIKAAHAAQAAELCESIPDATLEQRVRLALSCFGRGTTIPAPA